MTATVYLDSSALVKTVIREPESPALRRFLRGFPLHASSALARAEVLRAVRRSDPLAVKGVHEVMERLLLLDVSESLLVEAGLLDPPELRTLDAIHLSAAKTLGADLAAIVTYDARMADAALNLGLPLQTPS